MESKTMEKLQLKAAARDLRATNPQKLRRDGLLPAVLYGHKVQNASLTVNAREFDKVFKKAGESTIIDLETEDGKTHPVLIHEVQIHYLTSLPTHVDFYQVSMTEKLKAKVVLEFIGESPAVKTMGGVLVKTLNEVEVECLPTDLPHNIIVSIEGLKTLTDSIHVKDLNVPAKVKVLNPSDEMVAKIQPPRDVEAELAIPVVEDVSKVEGAAEIEPEAGGEAVVKDTTKPEKPEKSAKGGSASGGKEAKKE
jgi:large subunit ribosomal protein L25